MDTWEYTLMVASTNSPNDLITPPPGRQGPSHLERLREMGLAGWELVSFTSDIRTGALWYFVFAFKRRIPAS